MDKPSPIREGGGTRAATPVLLAAALALLGVTAITGVLDAFGLMATGEGSLHPSAGISGWLTLGVLAAAAWLLPDGGRGRDGYGRRARYLFAWTAAATMTLTVVAQWAPETPLRPVAGVLAISAAVGLSVALVRGIEWGSISVPQVGLVAGLVMAITAMAIGVLEGLVEPGFGDSVTSRVTAAHSPTVLAFSVLAAMALTEWRLVPSHRPAAAETWGLAQVLLFALGWVTLLAGAATNNLNALVSSASLHGIGVAIFLARIAPRLTSVRWSSPGEGRWFGLSVLYLAAHLGLLAHVAFGVTGGHYLEAALVPPWLGFAVDHVVFVGATTSALMGLVSQVGRSAGSAARSPAWAAALWGINVGLVASVVGRSMDQDVLTAAAGALMGIGLAASAVVGIARLQSVERMGWWRNLGP